MTQTLSSSSEDHYARFDALNMQKARGYEHWKTARTNFLHRQCDLAHRVPTHKESQDFEASKAEVEKVANHVRGLEAVL
jgi:hypothetical protein